MSKDKSNDLFKMYEDLISQENLYQPNNRFDPTDDDVETFVSLDELNKEQQEATGLKPVKGPADIEEELYFKRFTQKHIHKYTEKEMNEIRESCKNCIVHDFGEHDMYHMSDEERAKNDSLNELRIKLNGLKTVYRRIDQYVEAMRVIISAWELLSKDNYIHTDEEFFKLVSEGRIYNTSIPMPKMVKLNRYNMDLVIKYISNPELDPKDLMPKEKKDDWYDQFDEDAETEEEKMERLLSPEEVQYILDYTDNPPEIKVHDIKKKYIKGYDNRTMFGKKKRKKFSKKKQYSVDTLHMILNKIQSNPANRDSLYGSRSYLVTSSMFEPQKPKKDFMDDLRYTGSWTDKDALFVYDLVVEEERAKQHPAGDAYLTYGDRELQQFFRTLEENGINTVDLRRKMNATDSQLQQRDADRQRKLNKKTEAELLSRITKLNGNPKFQKLIKKAEKELNENIAKYNE